MSEFEVGQRVRVISAGDDNYPAEDGDIGTVVEVMLDSDLVLVDIDGKSERVWLFSYRLEKIEFVNEDTGKPTVKEGDLVRVIYAAGYTDSGYVTEGTLARVIEVPVADPSRPYVRREGSTEWPETFYIDMWEVVTDNIKAGDLTEGVNETVDEDEDEGPTLKLTAEGLVISGPLSFFDVNKTADMVNHPPHYKFSNGAEVIDITENLTSNGGQAVQYIARSTRLDGNNKGDVLEDLRKARWFIDREIERVEGKDA